jgi:hypothetical protein
MAGDFETLWDKWFDLLRQQATLSANFANYWLDTVQGGVRRPATLRFTVPANLGGSSGEQNNPTIRLPGVAMGNIVAVGGFRDAAAHAITAARLVVTEDPPNSKRFHFSLDNIAADAPVAGIYFGSIVNTSNQDFIAHVVIEVT